MTFAQAATAIDVWGVWVAIGSGLALTASLILGAVVKLTKGHIATAVGNQVRIEVPKVVALAMNGVNIKLDGISKDLAVVRTLELKIENGLSTKVANIDTRQRAADVLLAEMHGWLQAREEWDRNERRTQP